MSVRWTVTIDCAHPARVAAFLESGAGIRRRVAAGGFRKLARVVRRVWCPPEEWDDGAYIEDPDGVRPSISFLKIPEPKVVKNRAHLDVHVGGGRSEPWELRWPRVTEAVRRLTAAGATVLYEDLQDGIPDHVVMADPEGNEFDVL